ncbi:MAG: NAD-dependent malic enzyme [Cyanophyceae cyanobacterium]
MVTLTPNPSFSVTLRVQMPNQVGMLSQVIQAIATVGGNVGNIELVEQTRQHTLRVITVDTSSLDHADQVTGAVKDLDEITVLEASDRTFDLHQGGKISVTSKISLERQADLAMAYTPGVGRVCKAIAAEPDQVYKWTVKRNMVAIVSDGSAILGLGNLGPEAAMPVMEGKAMLFKEFGGVDAFPICVATQDADEIVETVKRIAPVFGGVNLEDITAPRCFEVEKKLREALDIPVFHDDQHGTAVVSLAALTNALRFVGKGLGDIRIVINGAGAAGIAIAQLLQTAGVNQMWMCDSKGLITSDRTDLNPSKQAFAVPKPPGVNGAATLADAMKGADVFLGVSAPGVVTPEMVASMAPKPIVFAMANPIPEIQPELVKDQVAVMATGRSDYPTQINNVLAFPGIFRGALDCRASQFTTKMYLNAALAIASLVNPDEITADNIVPSVFDPRVAEVVSASVQQGAREDGVARQ